MTSIFANSLKNRKISGEVSVPPPLCNVMGTV